MKKLILMSLCVLFLGSVSVWGAYAVSGQVKDESGNLVNGATVYINCYPSSGGALPTVTTASGQVAGVMGWYSGGWANSNCNGEKIVVKAVSSDGTKSGTLSWTAGGVADANKDVTIKAPSFGASYAELHCEATPVSMIETGIPVTCTVKLYVQMISGPIMVNGGTVAMHYDATTMSCSSLAPRPPFIFTTPPDISTPGTITVEAHLPSGYTSVSNGGDPTSFFDVFFEAIDVSTPKLSNVSVESKIYVDGIPPEISTFPSITQNLIGTPHTSSGYFLIDSEEEWEEGLSSGHVHPLQEIEWADYMAQWDSYKEEGEDYPDTIFKPANLYVYGGGGGGGLDPEDAGLVMAWGEDTNLPSGDYASAWEYDYLLDPDLSNSTITVTITPPQFGPSGQINAVSFGIKDINGNVRSWWWSCGPAPAPIPWNVPTTVTIDTSKVGIVAANPIASGYLNNPAFNIKNSQFFIVDENFNWNVFGQQPVPPPGQSVFGVMWNYWHNLVVTPNLPGSGANSKWFVKYSQPPEEISDGLINGWDEVSLDNHQPDPIMADDWKCEDDRPITDIHWWGSFKGWTQPNLPSVLPKAFHIAIWTDVPAGIDKPYSHPGTLIWENYCDSSVWNFAGYDVDPRCNEPGYPCEKNEACWQWAQFLSQDEWFWQKPMEGGLPNVYWLSISAIYDPQATVQYPWGWKTRPHFYNDDAVRITATADGLWPPKIGSTWIAGTPVEFPVGTSWDLAFELTTNEPAYVDDPIPGDIGGPGGSLVPDGSVDLNDFAIMAGHWLQTSP